jgi:hypothetical protein
MSTMNKHAATGPDGEPCTLMFRSTASGARAGSGHYSKPGEGQWSTSDGKRLATTDDPKVFRLVSDKTKAYTLVD